MVPRLFYRTAGQNLFRAGDGALKCAATKEKPTPTAARFDETGPAASNSTATPNLAAKATA
jgi:hypothetical protein